MYYGYVMLAPTWPDQITRFEFFVATFSEGQAADWVPCGLVACGVALGLSRRLLSTLLTAGVDFDDCDVVPSGES